MLSQTSKFNGWIQQKCILQACNCPIHTFLVCQSAFPGLFTTQANESWCMSSSRQGKSLPQPWDTDLPLGLTGQAYGIPTYGPVRTTKRMPDIKWYFDKIGVLYSKNWGSRANGYSVVTQQYPLKMDKALLGKKGHSTLGQCCRSSFLFMYIFQFDKNPSYRVMTSLVAQMVKHLPTMWETRVQSLGREDLLEKEMATHSSILAWEIPWMEEPGRL